MIKYNFLFHHLHLKSQQIIFCLHTISLATFSILISFIIYDLLIFTSFLA